jgi:hypothetical protein
MLDNVPTELPCENCGKPIPYDGVSSMGADAVCEHCGSKKPHTLRGNPLLPFLFFFLGWIAFALIDPCHWGDETMFFCAFGSFCLLIWLTIFFPILSGKKKEYRSDLKGCASLFLLAFGALSFFMFFVTKPEAPHGTSVTYVYQAIKGHAITDGIGSVPKSPPNGDAAQITFENRLEFDVRLYRLDHEGAMQYDSVLRSHTGRKEETFVGETWIVTGRDEQPLFYYAAGKGASDLKVNFAIIPPASKVP